jgi:hypothetical protein
MSAVTGRQVQDIPGLTVFDPEDLRMEESAPDRIAPSRQRNRLGSKE